MATKNVYLQFSNLKILLVPSYEKLPGFKVIAFPLWSSEPFTRLEVEKTSTPGANRVKWMNLDEYQGLFVCKSFSSFSHNFTANWLKMEIFICSQSVIIKVKWCGHCEIQKSHLQGLW